MQSSISSSEYLSNGVIMFPAAPDLNSIQKLCNRLNNHLAASSEKIVLDASKIERISTASIQLLLSLQKTCEETKRAMDITSNTITDDKFVNGLIAVEERMVVLLDISILLTNDMEKIGAHNA